MIRLMEQVDDGNKFVSALASLEVRSAIRRREGAGEISPTDADFAIESLAIENRRMVGQPLNPSVVETARHVIDRHSLRALDALQLATCMVARETIRATDICVVASDNALLAAARAEKFETFNPLDEGI